MISILVAIAITAVVMFLLTLAGVNSYIEEKSKKMEPHRSFGQNYFFMTQDQIQNACASIIKTEISYKDVDIN